MQKKQDFPCEHLRVFTDKISLLHQHPQEGVNHQEQKKIDMNNYFKHFYNDEDQNYRLQLLEDRFGLAALGFYWKVRERVHLCNGHYPLSAVMHWKSRGLKKEVKRLILTDSELGLFSVDAYGMIHLYVGKPHAGGDTGAHVGGDTGGDTGARSGYCPNDIDKKRDKRKEDSTEESGECEDEESEEELFARRMKEHYPRICRLKDPLSFLQYQRLIADGYTVEAIGSMLRQMENYEPLLKKCHSANLTIRNWMRRRV